jgi:hypothetical protein
LFSFFFRVKQVTRVPSPATFPPPPGDINGQAQPNVIFTDEDGNQLNVIIQPEKPIGTGITHLFI